MDEKINILSLAKMIILHYGNQGISPLKLQKLAYYVKVWSLVGGRPLVTAAFKKWEYGPVNLDIYYAFKEYGRETLPVELGVSCEISATQFSILQFVVDHYIQFSPYTLSTMTHHETPWRTTEKDQSITDQAIIDYYAARPFAQNITKLIAGEEIVPYYKLETSGHYAYVMDMSDEDAQRALVYESYEAYKHYQATAAQEISLLFKEISQ